MKLPPLNIALCVASFLVVLICSDVASAQVQLKKQTVSLEKPAIRVSIELPEENSASTRMIQLDSNTPISDIVLIEVGTTNIVKFKRPPSGSVSFRIDVPTQGKVARYQVSGFTANRVDPVITRSFEIAGNGSGENEARMNLLPTTNNSVVREEAKLETATYRPTGNADPAVRTSSEKLSLLQEKKVEQPVFDRPPTERPLPDGLAIVRPSSISSGKYVLEVRPTFDLSSAKKYRVTTTSGVRKSKPITVSISTDKKRANHPVPIQKIEIELFQGKNDVLVEVIDGNGNVLHKAEEEIECGEPCEVFGSGINTRAIVGLEQVGASSAQGKAQPFLNFFINVPLGSNSSPKATPARFSIWSDFRLTSTTAQRFADLSNITSNILRPGSDTAVNEVVQSFKINAGMDIRLIPEKSLFTSFLPGKSSISFTFGAGVTSPLVGGRSSVTEIFRIPKENDVIIPEFRALFPEIGDDKDNIAFVTPERDRFQRRWFAGGRLKTSFFKSNSESMGLSPAILDITAGQDEAITKTLRGIVLNFEGFTPFPIGDLDYLYLYGGITTRLTRKVNSRVPSFLMESADLADLANPLKTVLFSADDNPLTISNRDRYFFGIGIDFIRLFRKVADKEEK